MNTQNLFGDADIHTAKSAPFSAPFSSSFDSPQRGFESRDHHRFTVGQLNHYLKTLVETDMALQDLWVLGEISNFRSYSQGGQLYFNLSHEQAVINCVMYDTSPKSGAVLPENGRLVVARGRLRFWPKRGSLVLQVSFLIPEGDGLDSQAFKALKEKLEKEGLFSPDHKRPIPPFPSRIGIITSVDSAAMWDFVNVAKSAMGHVQLVIIPAIMQGAQSSRSIRAALSFIQQYRNRLHLDVVTIIRGGGSAQDLASFNDEALVRAVFDFPIPVVSGVGHEVDTTLLDYVADARAQTPSSAAHLIAAPITHLKYDMTQLLETQHAIIQRQYDDAHHTLCDQLAHQHHILHRLVSTIQNRLETVLHRLDVGNPIHKLNQGYAVIRHTDSGRVVKRVRDAKARDLLTLTVSDGTILAQVISTHSESNIDAKMRSKANAKTRVEDPQSDTAPTIDQLSIL